MSDIATFEAVDVAEAGQDISPTPAAVAPPEPTPLPAPAPEPAPRKVGVIGLLPIVAVSLAALASVASAAGLIVATRNVAETQHVIADLAKAHTADQAPAAPLVPTAPSQRKAGEQIDVAAASAGMALMPAAGTPDGRFATVTEIRTALADLRQDLAKHQGPGNVMVMEAMRDGQTDLANRISDLAAKVDRLERSLSSSRKAQP